MLKVCFQTTFISETYTTNMIIFKGKNILRDGIFNERGNFLNVVNFRNNVIITTQPWQKKTAPKSKLD